MQLSELFLNRYLYKDVDQSSETKDAAMLGGNAIDADVSAIASGGAAQDINEGNVIINPALLPDSTLNVANWGWGQTCQFSVTSANQVNWGIGTFNSASGDSYSIVAGNTGAMTQKTYIYLSLLDSETAYQFTTVSADSVGIGKVLIAVAENGSVSATFNLTEASQIVGDNILANSISTTQISAAYVYAGTISANDITAGTITGSTLRTSSSGDRVEIRDSTNNIRIYDSGGDERMRLDQNEFTFYNAAGDLTATLEAGEFSSLDVTIPFGGFLSFYTSGALYGTGFFHDSVQQMFVGAVISMYADLNMNSNDINNVSTLDVTLRANFPGGINIDSGGLDMGDEDIFDVQEIRLNGSTSNPSSNGELLYYDSGGSEGLRMQFGGSDFQFDATGV